MPLRRFWGGECRRCGTRDDLAFHSDGSVSKVTPHTCTKPVPGPPDFPHVFGPGMEYASMEDLRKASYPSTLPQEK
jgi:hypothetical protein